MKLRYSAWALAVTVGLLAASAGCSKQTPPPAQTSTDTRLADERGVREVSLEWSKAAAAKDLERTLAFYADDAVAFPPNAPVAPTKEDRRKLWSQAYAMPGFGITLATTKVEASKSADLAYETGIFELTANDKKGKPATTKGKYVVVWKKQADGAWRAVADIWNTDQ